MIGPPDLGEFLSQLAALDGSGHSAAYTYLRGRLHEAASRHLRPGDGLRPLLDSEDLTHDTILVLARAVPSFDGSGWPQFLAFAETILRRQLADQARHFRTQRRDPDRIEPFPEADPPAPATPTPSETAATRDDRERLLRLIAGLPESLAEVLRLRLDGQDYRAIAGLLGIGVDAARQRMSRALQILRDRW